MSMDRLFMYQHLTNMADTSENRKFTYDVSPGFLKEVYLLIEDRIEDEKFDKILKEALFSDKDEVPAPHYFLRGLASCLVHGEDEEENARIQEAIRERKRAYLSYVVRHTYREWVSIAGYIDNPVKYKGFELPDDYCVSSIAQQLLNEYSEGPYLISLEIFDREIKEYDVIDRWQIAPHEIIDRDDAMVLATKIIEAIERFEEDQNE